MVTELQAAGAERVVFELATRLDRARWDPFVVALARPGGDEGALARALRSRGIEAHVTRAQRKRDAWRLLGLGRVLRERRPELVHAHLFHANFAARVLRSTVGAPVISTHHVVERRRKRLRFFLDRLTCGLDARTVAVSPAVARWLAERRFARPDRIVVVENGIDLARFGQEPDRVAAREALGLPRDAPVVGALGRLDRQKGHDLLVRALPELARAHPGVVVAIAGEGHERDALVALARELGVADRLRLLGHREDVERFLAAIDVFAMPSRWEGFGLALVEALAAGRRCVATAVDSLPEVMGGAGALVPPEDPAALAKALAAALAEPGAGRVDAALTRARAFDVNGMVRRYEDLYTQVLGG
jgi:glycosyltransferase involved in cell wall biosynthesis